MVPNSKELTERLQMTHLPSTEDMKEEAKKAVEDPKPIVSEDDPKYQKEYTFDFKWTDGRGQIWEGKFTNHILAIREKQMVGLMRARMVGGLPYESLDPLTNELNLIVAHLTFSLKEEDRPLWAKDLRELTNVELLQALYLEVNAHEATFCGWRKA